MKRLIFILTCIFTAVGCQPEALTETLLTQTEVSLTFKGEVQMKYTPDTHQMSFNDRGREFRVHDDKLSEWFTVKYDKRPVSQGQTIVADVAWTATKGTKRYKGISLTVEKTDETGLIWLWNESLRIGIIIKDIH